MNHINTPLLSEGDKPSGGSLPSLAGSLNDVVLRKLIHCEPKGSIRFTPPLLHSEAIKVKLFLYSTHSGMACHPISRCEASFFSSGFGYRPVIARICRGAALRELQQCRLRRSACPARLPLILLWFPYGNRISGLRLQPVLDILHLCRIARFFGGQENGTCEFP